MDENPGPRPLRRWADRIGTALIPFLAPAGMLGMLLSGAPFWAVCGVAAVIGVVLVAWVSLQREIRAERAATLEAAARRWLEQSEPHL